MDDETRVRLEKREKFCNDQASKFNGKIAILVTAHNSQLMFMKACLESLQILKKWVLVVYDNPEGIPERLPDQETFRLMDQFFMKHYTNIPGPTYPQFWNFKHGVDILQGSACSHVFVMGADCVLERPEGLPEIVEMLGNGDILACSSKVDKHGGPFCGTKSFLVKKRALTIILKFLRKGFVPLDHQYGNLERRFGLAIKKMKLNEVRVSEMPHDDQFAHAYNENDECISRGIWGSILGFRHLAGEHKIRRLEKRLPVEEKYFNKSYLRRNEIDTLVKYWDTEDRNFLECWWKK